MNGHNLVTIVIAGSSQTNDKHYQNLLEMDFILNILGINRA